MTRREWLKQNPPPKAAGSVRDLLASLNTQLQHRQQLEGTKKQWEPHIPHWSQQVANARAQGDTATMNYANGELQKAQAAIADIDRQLAGSADVPARIAELQAELNRAAKCPQHSKDLLRHKNRPDDLFLCEFGPHFFLWTKIGQAPGLSPVDITKPLPDLDKEMDW